MKKGLMKIYEKIETLYDKQVHASGLAIFRIFYCSIFFCEIAQLFYFRHLVFDYVPYLQPYEINFTPILIIWLVIILLLIFGAFTRYVAIINYLFTLTFLGTIDTFEYHMFYVYLGMNFLMIFINVSQIYSIDRLREKLHYLGSTNVYMPKDTVSVLNYYILVLVGIGFVYFDSVFYKYGSDIWLGGMGLWLPASFPPFTHSDSSLILNIKWLALGLGYITLIFETIFIFVFFLKKWRPWLLLIGVGLHMGIVIEFAIPWFGLGVTALYCLLVPVSWWQSIGNKLSFRKKYLTIFYDDECPLCQRTKIILEHFDWFKVLEFKSVQKFSHNTKELEEIDKEELLADIYAVTSQGKVIKGIKTYAYAFRRVPLFLPLGFLLGIPGISKLAIFIYDKVASNRASERCSVESCSYEPILKKDSNSTKLFNNLTVKQVKIGLITFGISGLILLQLNVSYNSLLANRAKEYMGINESFIGGVVIDNASKGFKKLSMIFFGITNHAVFMDYHFEEFNHNIAVVFEDEEKENKWLPIVDKQGQPSYYNYGFNWVKWTFRVNSQKIDMVQLQEGLKRFTAFWAKKNNKSLEDLTFIIKVRKTYPPDRWQKDYLRKQMNKKWITAGHVYWKKKEFVSDIANIEEM